MRPKSSPQRKSPRRSSSELTPITDEEIFGAAGMNGSQISFLRNIPPSRAAVPEETLPRPGSESVPTGSVGIESVESKSDVPEAVPTDAVDTESIPIVSVPTAIVCGTHPSQRRIPVSCTTVQHGHTALEQTVYEFLWKAAGKWGRRESETSRLFRFKQPWLASVIGVHENSVRSILKSLTQKLAIEETAKAGPAQGREVRIYSFPAVLERRRQHGLIWAIRSHGVRLLTAEQLRSMEDRGVSVGSDIVGTVSLRDVLESESVDTESLPTDARK